MDLWLHTTLDDEKGVYHHIGEPADSDVLVKRNLGDKFPVLAAYSQTGSGSDEIDVFTDDIIGRSAAKPGECRVIEALRQTPSGLDEISRFAEEVKALMVEDAAKRAKTD